MSTKVNRPIWMNQVMRVVLVVMAILAIIGTSPEFTQAQSKDPPIWLDGQWVGVNEVTQSQPGLMAVPTVSGTYYRTYPGLRFLPTSSELTYSSVASGIYATTLASSFSFSLDFDLPIGATLTEIVFFVIDNDASNFQLGLLSYNPETGNYLFLENATSTGASSALQIITLPVDPTIKLDTTTTTYRLRVEPGVASNAHLLRGARIGFTMPTTFLPTIMK